MEMFRKIIELDKALKQAYKKALSFVSLRLFFPIQLHKRSMQIGFNNCFKLANKTKGFNVLQLLQIFEKMSQVSQVFLMFPIELLFVQKMIRSHL